MVPVSKSKFKSRALHYFREVEKTGRTVVVTDRGRPVAKVVPYSENPGELLSELRHTVVQYSDPLEPVGIEDWGVLK
jgi:prevent-host-death family protein